ncbi:MAG: hypothetical protein WA324_23950 [Bryobacteraceae bacterium]
MPSSETRQRAALMGVVLLSYCLVAYLVNAGGMNLTQILIGGGDSYIHGLPSALFATSFSAWNPWVQLGMYAFGNTEWSSFYFPALIPLLLFHNVLGFNLFTLSHYVMAAFFFYLYARSLKLTGYVAWVGGLLYMCSGFLLGHKGHQAILGAAIWLPLLLLFIDRYLRMRLIREAAFAGAALGISLLAGFPQTTTYMTGLAVAYFCFRCFVKNENGKPGETVFVWAVGLTTIFLVAVLIASLQLFAAAELLPTITRERLSLQMFNQDVLPKAYIGAFEIPGLFGGNSGVNCYYKGGSFVEFYSYMGQLALLLAAFAAVALWNKNRMVRFWVLAGSVAGILCLGLPPVQRVLYLVPIYNLFRAPARHLYEVNFAICVLALYGLDALLTGALQQQQVMRARRWAIIGVGIFLAIAVCASQYIRYLAKHLANTGYSGALWFFGNELTLFKLEAPTVYAHLSPLGATVLLPIVFFAASTLLLWVLNTRSREVWKAVVPLVMVLDIWLPYHTVYSNPNTTPLFHPASDSALAYLDGLDRVHYRIYPINPATLYPYPVLNEIHNLPVINDYGPFWEKRYQSIGRFDLDGESETAYLDPKLLNEVGVRYLVTSRQAVAAQLRHISQSMDAPATPLPMPDLNCAALNCAEATFPEPNVISLRHRSGQVAIIQIPVSFKPNTLYKIAFEVRASALDVSPLIVDLDAHRGAWGGSGAAQRRYVTSLGPDFVPTDVLISSVHMIAQNGYIRLFTLSPNAIELRNLSVGVARAVPNAFREAYGAPNGNVIFENPNALRRFRFVREALPVTDLARARAITLSAPFDTASQATVEGAVVQRKLDEGKVLSESIANDAMSWTLRTGAHSLFIVADTWFPGWRARVDGRDTPIRIVDGFLRGVFIDGAGEHRLEMRFHPWAPLYGAIATLAGIGLLIGCCFIRRPIGSL